MKVGRPCQFFFINLASKCFGGRIICLLAKKDLWKLLKCHIEPDPEQKVECAHLFLMLVLI